MKDERIERLIRSQEKLTVAIEDLVSLFKIGRMFQRLERRAEELDAVLTNIERRLARLGK